MVLIIQMESKMKEGPKGHKNVEMEDTPALEKNDQKTILNDQIKEDYMNQYSGA